MRKFIIGSVVLTAGLFVGCNSGGGECCGNELNGLREKGAVAPTPQLPTAKIDRNITTNTSVNYNEAKENVDNETYTVPAAELNREITFIFGCKNSIDNDNFDANENNKSIESCDWNVTMPTQLCSGDSISTGSTVKLVCSNDSDNVDTLIIRLKVTDDENQSAETNTTVKF